MVVVYERVGGEVGGGLRIFFDGYETRCSMSKGFEKRTLLS